MNTQTLYHATSKAEADQIVRDQRFVPKVDEDMSLPGQPKRYAFYLATSPDILGAIPHASAVVEMDVPDDVNLFPGSGDDPSKGWRELVYQPRDASPVQVANAKIVKTR